MIFLRGLKRYRRIVVAFTVMILLVVSISFTTREREGITWAEQFLSEMLAPVQKVLTSGLGRVRDFYGEVAAFREMRSENDMLRKRVVDYEALLNEVRELRSENDRLRALLGFTTTNPVGFIPAEVIGRLPNQWFASIIVDKGSSAGASKDSAVATGSGLVGRVVRVTPNTATVMLLTSRDSRVGGRVQRSRDPGIVEGNIEGTNMLHMRFFSREADVRPGDIVVTSGLGQAFPEGFLIGTVQEVGVEEFGLVRYAKVEPGVNFDRLEEVLILRENQPEPEAGEP